MRLNPAPHFVLALLTTTAVAVAPAAATATPRDPFTSLMDVEGPPPAKNPLSSYTLEQLRLAGLVVGVATPKAMLEAPNGRVHFARIGDRIGKNGARVARISRDGVTLVDEYRDVIGRLQRSVVTISAPPTIAVAFPE
jgi:type IV pilus assembly protein PilP